LGVGVNDHSIKVSLICHKFGVPVLRRLQLLGLLLQLLPRGGVCKLLLGLLHLSIAGSYGLLQRLRML
jgi:hypothetical protein